MQVCRRNSHKGSLQRVAIAGGEGRRGAHHVCAELRTGPWTTVEDVELATLSRVHWHNRARLLGYLNDLPLTEFEAIFYAPKWTDQPLVEIQ